MGRIFRRKQKGQESPIWTARFRVWDPRAQNWGKERDVSTNTRSEAEAQKVLDELEAREERRRRGIEPVTTDAKLGDALSAFVDYTQEWDAMDARNRKGKHPVLGHDVRGKSWWIRTLSFAKNVFTFFGDRAASEISEKDVREYDRWLARHGSAKGGPVTQTTRSKALKWFRRFCGWCVDEGHMMVDPTKRYAIPGERVEKQDRILAPSDVEAFWADYRKLKLKARCHVGLALELGARAGEVDTIRASDVLPESGTVRRRLWKAADAPEKVVRVSPALMADLTAWIREKGIDGEALLFPIRCYAGQKLLRKYRTSLRGLRRTVLTRLQDSGASLRVVQEAAGHTKLTTTQRYLGVAEDAVSDALREIWKDQREPAMSAEPGEAEKVVPIRRR
jgi:integrase